VEKYLRKCVDSILTQTHKDLEIILIDDGSKDGSAQICEDYAKMPNVKFIRKENGGTASARNAGLAAASGDYIHFTDSDDYLEPNMFEELLKISEEHNADYVGCSCFLDFENGDRSIKGCNDSKVRFMTANEYFENYLKGNLFLTVWNHICKREVCINVKFPERNVICYGEDGLTAIPTLLNAKKIAYLGLPLYHYYQREDSLVRGKITLPKIRAWFLQFDSWLAYSKTQGKIFDELIIAKYRDVVKKFARFAAQKTKIPMPAKLLSLLPYSFASFMVKLVPRK
jgi:glycosyltransferase involved in cell wall biosynthesis